MLDLNSVALVSLDDTTSQFTGNGENQLIVAGIGQDTVFASVQDKKAESLNQSAIQQKVPKGALRAEVKIEGQGGSAKSG